MDQLGFASLDHASEKKRTKRDLFLAEMAAVVPWVTLEALMEPHYPKTGSHGGRRPFPLAVMLRIYCLQQWYAYLIPAQKKRFMTSARCAPSPVSSLVVTQYRMRRPS